MTNMERVVGLRVKLLLGDPDPGMGGGIEAPPDPLFGTISGWYRGVHRRIYYYVTLDEELELDPDARKVISLGAEALQQPSMGHQRTRLIDMFESVDMADPPEDVLGPDLLGRGHGEAGVVHLVFGPGPPREYGLHESQEDQKKPLSERLRVAIGYADVTVM